MVWEGECALTRWDEYTGTRACGWLHMHLLRWAEVLSS
jgi:hypothetical protein